MKTILAVLSAATLTGAAGAHEWYPASCCGGTDCEAIPATEVKLTPAGWYVIRTGETISFERVQFSPDGRFHRCRKVFSDHNSGTRCLFVPGLGS